MAVEGAAATPISRFDIPGGGSLTLYPSCMVERGASHFETVPLAAITALRVSFERDRRRLGWGVTLIVFALIVFAISGPLGHFASGAVADMTAAGGTQGVARALLLLFRMLELSASLLPAV